MCCDGEGGSGGSVHDGKLDVGDWWGDRHHSWRVQEGGSSVCLPSTSSGIEAVRESRAVTTTVGIMLHSAESSTPPPSSEEDIYMAFTGREDSRACSTQMTVWAY